MAASTLVTLAVVAAGYELVANIRYYEWRASYDNEGWIGRLTVASPDPVLLWEYRPYGEAAGLTTNRYGFREFDYPTRAKPPGTRRVAFIGDSVTLGMGVPRQETFVARVATLSASAGEPLQTLNFGVDGYNALQIRELLTAKVLAFQPDGVVYVMCLNDFDFSDSSGEKIAYFRKPRFFMLRDLSQRWRSLLGTEFHRYHFGVTHDEVFDAVVEMKEVLEKRGIAFSIFLVPVFPDKPGTDPGYFAAYPLRDLHRDVLSEGAKRGIQIHDLLESFRRDDPPGSGYSLDLWHLDREGHRLVAESILKVLLSREQDGTASR